MIHIDRKYYMTAEMANNPYQDMPRPIIHNTTISAPHMHAMTLEKLVPNLRPGGRAIDIGAGSGYIAACFAHLMGP